MQKTTSRRPSTSPEMARAMVAATAQIENAYQAALLRAMITMMHDIPIRRMELMLLEEGDIDLQVSGVRIRHGQKERQIYISDIGKAAVRDYLAVRPPGGSARLWLHNKNKPVGTGWLYAQITVLCNLAGIVEREAVLPAAARRGTAKRFYRNGMSSEALRKMLGCSSTSYGKDFPHVKPR